MTAKGRAHFESWAKWRSSWVQLGWVPDSWEYSSRDTLWLLLLSRDTTEGNSCKLDTHTAPWARLWCLSRDFGQRDFFLKSRERLRLARFDARAGPFHRELRAPQRRGAARTLDSSVFFSLFVERHSAFWKKGSSFRFERDAARARATSNKSCETHTKWL